LRLGGVFALRPLFLDSCQTSTPHPSGLHRPLLHFPESAPFYLPFCFAAAWSSSLVFPRHILTCAPSVIHQAPNPFPPPTRCQCSFFFFLSVIRRPLSYVGPTGFLPPCRLSFSGACPWSGASIVPPFDPFIFFSFPPARINFFLYVDIFTPFAFTLPSAVALDTNLVLALLSFFLIDRRLHFSLRPPPMLPILAGDPRPAIGSVVLKDSGIPPSHFSRSAVFRPPHQMVSLFRLREFFPSRHSKCVQDLAPIGPSRTLFFLVNATPAILRSFFFFQIN